MLNTSISITSDSDILGGIPVFAGTRVPATTLLDYVQKGYNLDDFLDDYPTVTCEQVQEVLASFQAELVSVP